MRLMRIGCIGISDESLRGLRGETYSGYELKRTRAFSHVRSLPVAGFSKGSRSYIMGGAPTPYRDLVIS
jgi:hypothetical protein